MAARGLPLDCVAPNGSEKRGGRDALWLGALVLHDEIARDKDIERSCTDEVERETFREIFKRSAASDKRDEFFIIYLLHKFSTYLHDLPSCDRSYKIIIIKLHISDF